MVAREECDPAILDGAPDRYVRVRVRVRVHVCMYARVCVCVCVWRRAGPAIAVAQWLTCAQSLAVKGGNVVCKVLTVRLMFSLCCPFYLTVQREAGGGPAASAADHADSPQLPLLP